MAIPHDREIIHVIQRGFTVDGQDGIRNPKGMHGYRLEVEAHIITASAATGDNLRQCVGAAGVDIQQFVLNPLASGEVVLTEQERQADIDTLGGLVMSLTDRVPARGELVTHPSGIAFEVIDADPRRVKRLRVRNLPPKPAKEGA